MAKELIVSVNGREKKIAIIEDDRVTEFYIERGEQNQGIVGNIYKGRVMRVLPGMQSAFVDVGLERDAFLYVSDFFDEEAEFERIVVDKSKEVDTATAARAAAEHIEQSRVERERHIEATHERAEPLRESEAAPAAAAPEVPAPDQQRLPRESSPREERLPRESSPREEESGRGRRGRRGRRPGRDSYRDAPAAAPEIARSEAGAIETPFGSGAASFQRVVDEEERASNGEMLKDARLQERFTDEVHAVEFDFEDIPSAPVGSLLSSEVMSGYSFHRVDDSDVASEAAAARPPEVVAARVHEFVDEIASGSAASPSFERVSDDEEAESASKETRRAPAKRGAKKKEAAPRTARKKPASKRSAKTKQNAGLFEEEAETPQASDKTGAAEDDESYPDSQAGVTTGREHEEFATRRGGRRRRRPSRPTGAGEGDGANGKDTAEPEIAAVEAPPEVVAPEPIEAAAAPREGRRPTGPRHRFPPRRERSQPTITDLLRDGQEILVQIAKEPIAKKGARITSHIALPGRFLVYMPTVEHLGVSRKIESETERARLRKLIQRIRTEETVPSGGFIVRTAGVGISEADLRDDARFLVRTWLEIRGNAEKAKAPALVHRDLDLVQRILRDQLSEEFSAIRIDSEDEYERVVEFINRMQPRMVKRVKLYTRDEPILEAFGVQAEIDKAIKPRVWLKSGGYLVINQTEALVAIDVNTGKFVGRGASRLEDTITRTNLEAVDEIVRQIRLRDLGGIIVLDLIDMEDRRNRTRVMQALQEALRHDKSPTKVLAFNDFGLVIMTRKRVKQSLERTLCATCSYCQGAGLVKSPQTVCYEILEQARGLAKEIKDEGAKQSTLRVNPEVARTLRGPERDVLTEIEDYLGAVDITSDPRVHQEQFDFAFI
jgi:ribonuclease G